MHGIAGKDYIVVCDYDILNTTLNKHCDILNRTNKATKMIIKLVQRSNAKYAYKRIIEYYTPQVSIINVEPTCGINDAISLFKTKRPIYITTDYILDLDVKGYTVKKIG